MEKYDIGTDTWTLLASMDEERSGHCSSALGNYIYVFGGSSVDTRGTRIRYINTIERLKMSRKGREHWETIEISSSLKPRPRQDALMATLGANELFIAGGSDSDNKLADGWIFNSQSQEMHNIFNMGFTF